MYRWVALGKLGHEAEWPALAGLEARLGPFLEPLELGLLEAALLHWREYFIVALLLLRLLLLRSVVKLMLIVAA